MHFRTSREPFLTAAQAALRAVLTKSTVPALTGILVTAAQGEVTLAGTDLELGIESRFEAQVKEEGQVLIPARYLVDILRRLPEGEITLAEENGGEHVALTAGSSHFRLLTLPAADFPPVGASEAVELLRLPELTLRTLLQQVTFAAAHDGLRQLLTSVLFSLRGASLRLVATDGHRLALAETPLSAEGASGEYLVPARTLEEVARLLGGGGEVSIAAGPKQIIFTTSTWTLVSRLVEGNYLPYESVLPRSFSRQAQVKRTDFLAALERAELFSSEKINAVHLNLSREGIRVQAQSAEVGRMEELVPADVAGEDLDISFNGRYLIEPLRILGSEDIELKFTGPESAAVIGPAGTSTYLYLVMPVTTRQAV
ncbi:MAG: polymerase subunit beta [Bacillota bacterium]|nr:polymerase subunit beta [Bacillota bacterium]